MTATASSEPVTAIFGAGPGLGFAAARFRAPGPPGRPRNRRERLEGFAEQLAAEGISATVHAGDIGEPEAFDEVAAAVVAACGQLDVAIYQMTPPSPRSPRRSTSPPTTNGPISNRPSSRRSTPLERSSPPCSTGAAIARHPRRLPRGPIPQLAQLGVPLAGLRHHLLGLAEAAAHAGCASGILTVGGLVLGSDIHRVGSPMPGRDFPGALDPDELARLYGDLLTGDDHPERLAGPLAERPAAVVHSATHAWDGSFRAQPRPSR